MTEERQPRLLVTAEPGSRREELLASYESAKAAAEEAASRFKTITDALKADLSGAYPGVEGMTLSGAPGLPRLSMSWRKSWRVDTRRLKEEQPLLYVQYAVQSGTWDLRAQ
jgi:hypothetical protein